MPTNLDRFVSGSITRRSRSVIGPSFAMPLIFGYMPGAVFENLTKTYEDPSELLEDLEAVGLDDSHPTYQAALRLCSQKPRVAQFKVGKRATAPTQSLRVTPPASPTASTTYEITIDGVTFQVATDASPSVAEMTAAFAAIINTDTDAIIASGVASAAAPQTLTSTAFNGVISAGRLSPARNFVFVFNNHADWDATTLVVTGRRNGRVVTENIAIPNGGNATVVGTKVFDMDEASLDATTFLIPTQSGTNGTLLVGVGVKFDDTGHLDITATDGTTHIDIAADVAGKWFAYTGLSAGLAIEDRTADPGIAADLAALREADAAWYLLHLADAQSSAQILAAAAWAELELVYMIADSIDTAVETSDAASTALSLEALGYLRTKLFQSRKNHGRHMAIGIMSRLLASPDPSERFVSIEYGLTPLVGCETDDYGADEINRMAGTTEDPASGNGTTIYIEAISAGANEGTGIVWGAMGHGGEWVDVIVSLDYARSDLQIAEFNYFLNRPRVPFTRDGIASLESVVESRLNVLSGAPYNIFDPTSIAVRPKAYEATTASERQTRRYNGVKWGATLQGAIRAVDVSGDVSP
jgi:hypothetical protein